MNFDYMYFSCDFSVYHDCLAGPAVESPNGADQMRRYPRRLFVISSGVVLVE